MSGKPQVLLYSKDMPLTEAVFKAAGMDFRNFVVDSYINPYSALRRLGGVPEDHYTLAILECPSLITGLLLRSTVKKGVHVIAITSDEYNYWLKQYSANVTVYSTVAQRPVPSKERFLCWVYFWAERQLNLRLTPP